MKSFFAHNNTSLVFLSLLCFSLADVRDGLGPFLGVFLQSKEWTPDAIGYVMTLGGLASLVCTTPLGAVADATHRKRVFLSIAVVVVILGCGIIFYSNTAFMASISKVLQSVASAGMAPALAGLTLGMVGQKGYAARLGTNEAWNHAGNASTAILGGIIGYFWGIEGVFLVMAVMGVMALLSLRCIRPEDVDYNVARGIGVGADNRASAQPLPWQELLQHKGLLSIAFVLFFFHLGNAAMLPLLGQGAVAQFDVNPAAYTGATVVLAQTTMIITALAGARLAQRKGYGWLFIIALLALPVRGCVAGLWESPWNIVPVQILDGVGAGLFGVATPGITARVLEGSGRINMGLGLVLTIQGLGAAFSNTYGGVFAHYFSYSAAFLALALAPCLGLLLLAVAVKKIPLLHHSLFARQ